MSTVTVDGPGGRRTVQIADPDLAADMARYARQAGYDVTSDDVVTGRLADHTVAELRAQAAELGIAVPANARKADLVEAIEAADAD